MFTLNHLIWMSISILLVICSLILLKKYKVSLEKVLTISCFGGILSEVTKTFCVIKMVPLDDGSAFTPYIEIPKLYRYNYKVTEIPANVTTYDDLHLWQYSDKDVSKLRDTSYKALFIVNPSNPPSYTLAPETVELLVDIVERWNPNLMIVTDDVIEAPTSLVIPEAANREISATVVLKRMLQDL